MLGQNQFKLYEDDSHIEREPEKAPEFQEGVISSGEEEEEEKVAEDSDDASEKAATQTSAVIFPNFGNKPQSQEDD